MAKIHQNAMAVPRRGVLRHHKQLAEAEVKDKFEDLLVFGYACKLFRDDEKAAEIDQGKLLIPWMGDDSIKIDRTTYWVRLDSKTNFLS